MKKLLLILFVVLLAMPCSGSMRQLAKGTSTTYDIYNGGALPGAAIRLDGVNEYWAESGVAHWVVVNLQIGIAFNPITAGATITVSVATGTTDGNARIMMSHVVTGTATTTQNMWTTAPIVLTTTYDTIKVYVHSDNAADDVTTVTATLLDIHSFAPDVNTWYVAKTGSTTGPGHSFDEAYTVIQDVVDIAGAGDKIIIYPGTYVENIDLATDNDGLILEGTNRTKCIIAPATGDGILVGDYNTLENLTINAMETLTGIAVNSGAPPAAVEELNIINCTLRGGHTGLLIEAGTEGGNIRDSSIEGSINAVKPQARDMIFTNCRLESTIDTAAVDTEIVVILEPNNAIFKSCHIRFNRTTISVTADSIGVKCVDSTYSQVFDGCVFKCRADGGGSSGDLYGIKNIGVLSKVAVVNSVLLSTHAGSSGSRYDLYNDVSGHLRVGNTYYETSSGPIMGLEKNTLDNLNTSMDRY